MWCHKVERDAHPSAWAVGEEQLPPLTLDQLKDVCRSYAPSAGLGWDGLNPRVLLQLGDDALQRFLDIVVTFEECPGAFEAFLTQIIFIPKVGGGGIRPIGLLALFPRLWSKLRRPRTARISSREALRSIVATGLDAPTTC